MSYIHAADTMHEQRKSTRNTKRTIRKRRNHKRKVPANERRTKITTSLFSNFLGVNPMICIYCKTSDNLKQVANFLCTANSAQNKNSDSSWATVQSEDDCWAIETNCNKDTAAMIYKISDNIFCIEVDDNCAQKVIEPLMKKYGFENIKWLTTK